MFETSAGVTPFAVNIFTSDNGGHSPETVAQLCVERIIKVADTAPPELAQQALAFREQLLAVVLQYVRLAAAEDRATVCTKLEQSGMTDLAKHVRSL